MDTGTTLFGGLALVIVIFAFARRSGLSAELAGLGSALIPLSIYTVLLFGNWPGLDVVSIHIAVFLIAAFVLSVFSQYRAKQKRMHWVPKALIVFFAILVVMNAGFLYVSTQGLPGGLASILLPGHQSGNLHTGFSGTTRHGEDAAKAIGSDLSRMHRNTELGWNVRVEGLRMPSVGNNALWLEAEDRDGKPLNNLKGVFQVSRPGGKTTEYVLNPAGSGAYQVNIEFSGSGLWIVELDFSGYRQSWEINVPGQDAK